MVKEYMYCGYMQESVWMGLDRDSQHREVRKVATGFQRNTTAVT